MTIYDEYRNTLSVHKIDKIEYYVARARYPRLHGKNAIKGYHGFGGNVNIVSITTNQGAKGWASLDQRYKEAINIESKIINRKLSDIFDPESGILNDCLLPFDIALHDLAGKILGIPVSKMINPNAVDHVNIYDGAIYMNDIIPEDKPFGVQAIIDDCIYDYELGHRTMKIKIGRSHMWMEHNSGIKRDIEIVRKVSENFQDITLMVDANDGYTLKDCKKFLEGINGINLYWFEEPFRENLEMNTKLKEYISYNCPMTYIADGESDTDIKLLFDLAEKKVLDIWMPDVCGYGFTPWRKLIKKLVKHGYLGAPHAWGQVAKTHYSAHLAAAYPHNIPYVEGVHGHTEGIDYSGYQIKNGILAIPDNPGFGMDLIWAPQLIK